MKRACLFFFLFSCLLTAARGQTPAKLPYQEVAQQEVPVDKQASYRGGLQGLTQYVIRNLKYPPEARRQNIEGKVFVKFTVGTNGKVNRIEILKSDHPLLSKEAQRLIKGMGKWRPAYVGENPVEVPYVFPLTFKQS